MPDSSLLHATLIETAQGPRVGAWLAENVPGFRGPVCAERLAGGQSNPTFRLKTPDRSYVLRCKPLGELLPGAHAVEREAKVMRALGGAGFAVPRILGACDDPAVLGSPFYVMEFLQGRVFRDASFDELPREQRAAYFDAMNATIAALHRFDFRAIGLADYGRPENYVARQTMRWSRQYASDREFAHHPAMDALVEWLPQHIPAEEHGTIVHGDFRVDNLLYDMVEPRIIGVLDWELSTIGNPIADFAYHAMMYRMPPDIWGGLAGLDLASLGLPDERNYVAAYFDRAGRPIPPDYAVYLAFGMFRFAGILQGIIGRKIRGTASASDDLATMRAKFSRVAEIAWATVADA